MRRLAVAAALALACAGCKKTLHWKIIEDGLAGAISAKAGMAATVTCPETEVRAHLRFDCAVRLANGEHANAQIELLDQAGSYHWSVSR